MKKNDLVFLAFIAIIFLIFNLNYIYKGLTGNFQKDSVIENRSYNIFDNLRAKQILTNEFQMKIESSMSDQFLFAEAIRKKYNSSLFLLDYKNINKSICKDKYVKVGHKTAIFDCSDYLVYQFDEKYISDLKKSYETNFNLFNKLNNIADTYFYYVNSSPDYDFENKKNITNISNEFKRYFDNEYKLAEFKISNYNDYKKFLYKTDHHWNQDASYRGYTEIIKFITDEEPKEIETTYVYNDTNFYGYLAREIKYFGFKEKIKYHYVELGDYVAYVDGKEDWINSTPFYLDGTYSRDEYFYHYAYLSGNNAAEKIIDFHNEEKENLLVIMDSFGNAVLPLIASHFNKTYALDHRYIKGKINLKEYIEKHNIQKVLVIYNNYLFENRITSLEVK